MGECNSMNNRRLILSSLFVFLISASFGQNKVHSDTIRIPNTDTTVVKWFKGQKLTDEHIFISGKLCFKRFYFYRKKNGIFGYLTTDKRGIKPRHEEYKEFYSNGTIKEYGVLNKFVYNGFRKSYYQNGNLQCDCNIKNGKRDSINKSHYENGQLQAILFFNNGKEDGKEIWYYENGQFKGELVYDKGKLMEINSLFDNKGRPLKTGTLNKGNGTLNIYSDEGNLKYVEVYKKGKKIKTIKP
jgi:antitoxin component YwqK of YwqJK toxin-antitoxin module